ncbi:MAG: hypothetical protein JWR72_1310 [Flavisolibacter sp.]|jgi:hypothetical protein|nr:hypothetical protein [Flavisolibacter sp.]
MKKLVPGVVLLCSLLSACKNGDGGKDQKTDSSSGSMASFFKAATPPYQFTDTGLLKNKDTVSLPSALILPFVADSIKNNYFGKKTTVKYTPLVKLKYKEAEAYYLVKAAGGSKKAVLLLVFDNQNNFAASYPFLLPDENPNTSQTTAIDKNFTITKSVTQRNGPDVSGEGKEVVAYDAVTKSFSLIMMDALNDSPSEAVNPIDTFPKTNKLAGDYYLNKKNFVAIRDGRYANQLLVYIHTENEEGDCKGQLKGDFLITSPASAAYRLGGDPCVLGLNFAGNSVTIKEESGCGNHRGLDCPLSGTFTRKKAAIPKQTSKKAKRK